MADREPTRKNPDLTPETEGLWADSTESSDAVQSETFGFDFDLSSAINETMGSANAGSPTDQPFDIVEDEIIVLDDESPLDHDPLAMPAAPAAAVPGEPVSANTVKANPVKASAVQANPIKVNPLAVGVGAASLIDAVKIKTAGAPSGETAKADESAPAQPVVSGVRGKSWTDRLLMRSVPSWLVSMILHVGVLMTLAAIQIEPVRDAIGVIVTAVSSDESQGVDEGLELSEPSVNEPAQASMDQAMASSSPSQFASADIALTDTASLVQPVEASVDVGTFGAMVENIVPSSALNASSSRISSSLMGRSAGSMKSELLERFGGNAASEKSVAMALDWIAKHQDRSGGWTFGHSAVCRGECKGDGDYNEAVNGATALALLPFLGAGQTHTEGKYKTTVLKGLTFLISRMKVTKDDVPHGSWHEPKGNMYSHGLASIVVCEAYAMTRDPNLLQPAQLAVNYIAYAQDPRGGGWRYSPKQAGDTSVVGWQLMALKSGAMGNLSVPSDCFRKADSFLNFISVNDGAYYGYDAPTSNFEGRASTTAVGLLCRMYLGWSKDRPGMKEGVAFLSKRGPNINDLYYSYYATQVMRQHGGEEWTKWNKAMRDGLIKVQETEGHAAGSFYMEKGPHHEHGGRLYCTALSTMILEVYYRHMPLYSEKSSDEEFEF